MNGWAARESDDEEFPIEVVNGVHTKQTAGNNKYRLEREYIPFLSFPFLGLSSSFYHRRREQ